MFVLMIVAEEIDSQGEGAKEILSCQAFTPFKRGFTRVKRHVDPGDPAITPGNMQGQRLLATFYHRVPQRKWCFISIYVIVSKAGHMVGGQV